MNKKMTLSLLAIVAVSSSAVFAGTTPGSGVVDSVHDMNHYTNVQAESQGRVCAYCHTPHHALTEGNDYLPLWSHTLASTTNYTSYASATIDAQIPANPDIMMEGPSKLCMSCHDGNIAVDTHYSTNGSVLLDSDAFGDSAIAKDAYLSNDHPIGFVYDYSEGGVANGPISGNPQVTVENVTSQNNAPSEQYRDNWIRQKAATYIDNGTLKIQDRLYSTTAGAIMTCATCHDVHNKKNVDVSGDHNYLLLSPNRDSKLCLTCHIK